MESTQPSAAMATMSERSGCLFGLGDDFRELNRNFVDAMESGFPNKQFEPSPISSEESQATNGIISPPSSEKVNSAYEPNPLPMQTSHVLSSTPMATICTEPPQRSEDGTLVAPVNEDHQPYVNVYMVIDPKSMTCLVPKQVISCKRNNVVSTAVFGPQTLSAPKTDSFISSPSNDSSSSKTVQCEATDLEPVSFANMPQSSLESQMMKHQEPSLNTTVDEPLNSDMKSDLSRKNMEIPELNIFPPPAGEGSLLSFLGNSASLGGSDQAQLDQGPTDVFIHGDNNGKMSRLSLSLANGVDDWPSTSLKPPPTLPSGPCKPSTMEPPEDASTSSVPISDSLVEATSDNNALVSDIGDFAGPKTHKTSTASKKRKKTSSPCADDTNSDKPMPPLKPLSAYNYFFRFERSRLLYGAEADWSESKKQKLLEEHWGQDRTKKRRHRRTHGKIDFTSLSKLVSAQWKKLSEDRKDFFRQIASRDFERFKRECSTFESAPAPAAPEAPAPTMKTHASIVG